MDIALQFALRVTNIQYTNLDSTEDGSLVDIGIGTGWSANNSKKTFPIAAIRMTGLGGPVIDPTDNAVTIVGGGEFYRDVKLLLEKNPDADKAKRLALSSLATAIYNNPEIWNRMMHQVFEAGEKSGERKARRELKDWIDGVIV